MDPEATEHVAGFEALGFAPVGAYAFDPEPGRAAAVTVLLGPKADEYALVTDLVLDVVSIFGSRLFITANSAAAALPSEYLSNALRGADPDEIVRAHRRGLELLAAQGLAPDPIDRERLLEIQLSLERRCSVVASRLKGTRAPVTVRVRARKRSARRYSGEQAADRGLAGRRQPRSRSALV